MSYYRWKDEGSLVWAENRARIALEARLLTGRLLNEVLAELDDEVTKQIHQGGLKRVSSENAQDKFRRLYLQAVQRELGDGTDEAAEDS